MKIILHDPDKETGLIPITFENVNNSIFEGYYYREQLKLEEAYYRCLARDQREGILTGWVHFKALYEDLKKQEYFGLRLKNFQRDMQEHIRYANRERHQFSAGTIIHKDNEKYGVTVDKVNYCYIRITEPYYCMGSR